MMNIKAVLKADGVIARLAKIAKAGKDLKKPLNAIGDVVISSVEENFEQEGRYESAESYRGGNNRWADLADSTKAARAKKGKWPGKKLQMSQGGLAASIHKNVGLQTVAVGTNKPYAAIQQFGGQAGRGRSVTIPARPFLVLQDEDVEEIRSIVERHISKQ